MATATLIGLGEYLETTYRPDCDWIAGEIRERNMGEGQHATIQGFLIYLFRVHAAEWGVRAYPEMRVQTSELHYRVADLCVVHETAPYEAIVRTPPVLCIEILSRDDRMSEMQERIEDYLGMGVRTVWVIDPRRRRAYETDAVGAAVPAREHLKAEGTSIRIAIEDVFAELVGFAEGL